MVERIDREFHLPTAGKRFGASRAPSPFVLSGTEASFVTKRNQNVRLLALADQEWTEFAKDAPQRMALQRPSVCGLPLAVAATNRTANAPSSNLLAAFHRCQARIRCGDLSRVEKASPPPTKPGDLERAFAFYEAGEPCYIKGSHYTLSIARDNDEFNPEYAEMAERRIAPHRDQMQLAVTT